MVANPERPWVNFKLGLCLGYLRSTARAQGPRRISMRFALGCLVGLVMLSVGSSQARADVAPPQGCTAPGQPCDNAGPAANLAGVCATSTCNKRLPSTDGSIAIMAYPCNLCQVVGVDGSAGGSGGSGSGGASTDGGSSGSGGFLDGSGGSVSGTGGAAGADAGTPDASTSTPARKNSGCALAPDGPIAPLATWMTSLWLAGAALLAARRRGANRPGLPRSRSTPRRDAAT
jgi:hypothetical protein